MLMNRHRHIHFSSLVGICQAMSAVVVGDMTECHKDWERGNLYSGHFVKINLHLMSRNVSKSFRYYFSASCGW